MVELNQTEIIVTDRLASSGAALREVGAIDERKTGLWLNGTVNLPNGGRAKTGGFPLALRGDTQFGDLAPGDHRLGTKRAIVR